MLVDREAELAILRDRLADSAPVVLLGEAGIGKSRLMREAATLSGRRVYEGGGISTLAWKRYFALARALAAEPPGGDPAAAAAFVVEAVDDGVLIVDDLQWVDSETLAVLPLVAARVALLCAVRRGDPAALSCLDAVREFDVLEVDGLSRAGAVALVRHLRPHLQDGAVKRVVARAGGNPLLLDQLSLADGAGEALRLGLGVRLEPHSRASRLAAARLALLGRPAERSLAGDVTELLEAGLVVESDGRVDLRHELLGQAALDLLGADDRRRLHSELAAALADPAEAAPHHAAAGEREPAHASALRAARRSRWSSERARHLGLAAATAPDGAAERLRLAAAEASLEAADYPACLAQCTGLDPPRAAWLRARAHFHLGDRERAEQAIADGLASTAGSGTADEVALRIEEARLPVWDWNAEVALPLARTALVLARQVGAHEARAELMLAAALLAAWSPDCVAQARSAAAAARSAGDSVLELEAAAMLAAGYQNTGQAAAAHAHAARTAERALAVGQRARALDALHLQAHVELHTFGDLKAANARNRDLLREPRSLGHVLARTRANLALGLAQAGRDRDALSLLDAPGDATVDDRSYHAFVAADVHWLAGRSHEALATIERARDLGPFQIPAALTAAWAAFEAGRRAPAPLDEPEPLWPGALPESRGLAHLASGEPEVAESLFLRSAELWDGLVCFPAVRSLWGAGEAALRARAPERARERLLAVERRAADRGYAPLLARIRRSLRRAGSARTAPRRTGRGSLTAREREVLGLVAEGLRTREIAIRIGVAPSTVDSQIKSAMRKLGARTRAQAALEAVDGVG